MAAKRMRSHPSAKGLRPESARAVEAQASSASRIRAAIRQIPRGKVSTYGRVARAAGLPGHARQVAQVLRSSFALPWQRVLGAGGAIKLRGASAIEQRLRLEAEGVAFRGRRVDMRACEFRYPPG
ncbi:MAG: MGMT family protein [Acidobacteria bacterium]|nr:MGMT family protein [Acidobacteriota bacterium]MBV9623270.1 MGMT family protein [Acidobacteriota bacterium]